jgi:hypothetical protein
VSSDNSLSKDSALFLYHKLLKDAIGTLQREYAPGPELKKWAEEAGYVNVTENIVPLPIGVWPRDKKLVRKASSLYFPLISLFFFRSSPKIPISSQL